MAVAFVRRRLLALAAIMVLSSIAMGQVAPAPTTDENVPHGKVLFNRNQDSPTVEKTAKVPADQPAVAVTDAERASLTIT